MFCFVEMFAICFPRSSPHYRVGLWCAETCGLSSKLTEISVCYTSTQIEPFFLVVELPLHRLVKFFSINLSDPLWKIAGLTYGEPA